MKKFLQFKRPTEKVRLNLIMFKEDKVFQKPYLTHMHSIKFPSEKYNISITNTSTHSF